MNSNITIDKTKVLSRIHLLETIYNKLSPAFDKDLTFLNKFILRNVVESYFFDVERVKQFHGIDLVDSHKKAAYTFKWVIKLRPIQIIPKKSEKISLLSNEIFALYVGLTFLDININNLSAKYLKNLLYIFHYRNIEPQTFASKMYVLEKSLLKEFP